MYVKPKKHLGQHFLRNDEICQRIAQSIAHPEAFSTLLEIGPGTGALTKHLLDYKDHTLWVAEIDGESVAYLKQHFPVLKERIIEEDILRFPLDQRMNGQVAVIGNFPYNISSQILFWVLDHRDQVPEVVGMFQMEVARRIAGGPGSKDYGILSVLIQAAYKAEYLFTVEAIEFDPPPKVRSGVIRLVRRENEPLGCDEAHFKRVVKTAFNQRRKTLRNSLKSLVHDHEIFSDPIFTLRPEQLSVQEFVRLTLLIMNQKKS